MVKMLLLLCNKRKMKSNFMQIRCCFVKCLIRFFITWFYSLSLFSVLEAFSLPFACSILRRKIYCVYYAFYESSYLNIKNDIELKTGSNFEYIFRALYKWNLEKGNRRRKKTSTKTAQCAIFYAIVTSFWRVHRVAVFIFSTRTKQFLVLL